MVHLGAGRVVKLYFTAFDPDDPHYDPKSNRDDPRWEMVDVQYVRKTRRTIALSELKENPKLADLALVRRGNRLSVMPVSEPEWQVILEME